MEWIIWQLCVLNDQTIVKSSHIKRQCLCLRYEHWLLIIFNNEKWKLMKEKLRWFSRALSSPFSYCAVLFSESISSCLVCHAWKTTEEKFLCTDYECITTMYLLSVWNYQWIILVRSSSYKLCTSTFIPVTFLITRKINDNPFR